MSKYIDPQNVEATIRDIQQATEGLSAALRDVESARSHLQSVQAQSDESSGEPGAAGHPETTVRNALEQAQRDAERERSTLQQAVRQGERLLDRLDEGIRSAKDDRSSLQSGQKKVQNRGARSEMASGVRRLQEEIEQLKTWRRELSSALQDAGQALSSPGQASAASPSSSRSSSSSGPRYAGSGGGYGASSPAYTSSPTLGEQLDASPDARAQDNGPAYAGRASSETGYDPSYSNGPAPALGGGSNDGSWLEKLVRDTSANNVPSRRPSGLVEAVRSLTTDMDAAPGDSSAARRSLYDTIQTYDPSVQAAPGDPHTSPSYDGW